MSKLTARKLNILVLFAGAGLATRGLLNAGHTCTDVELDPSKQHLSKILNPEATHILADVRDLDPAWIASFDAVWSSPPCQGWSEQGDEHANDSGNDLLWWSLQLNNDVLWVENVISKDYPYEWGVKWNAAQFTKIPKQRRRRFIGGHHRLPYVWRGFKYDYPEYRSMCPPAVLASEIGHGGNSRSYKKERRKASRYFMYVKGRSITLDDMAAAQGFKIPELWHQPLEGFTDSQWVKNLSTAIGNGVPVYMAQAFAEAYSKPKLMPKTKQLSLFEAIA